jgi:hypothetical protein
VATRFSGLAGTILASAGEPKFAPAQQTLGLAYEQMGMFEEAIRGVTKRARCVTDLAEGGAALRDYPQFGALLQSCQL